MVAVNIKYLLALIIVSAIVYYGIYQIQLAKLQAQVIRLESLTRVQKQSVVSPAKPNLSDNLVVLYNRVPKTGSTSFVGIAYDLCKKGQYHVLHVNVTGNSHVLSLTNQIKFVTNVTEWGSMKPALYHGHFAYIDFSKFGVFKPLYINVIRKPLDRFISYYYFLRYGDNFRPYLVRRKAGNTMTFDECVQQKLPECDPNAMWLQVPFFCGHASNCWKPGNKWALTEAKKNLVNNYFLVGVTEELEDFIAVLETSLPRIFKGALEHYTGSNKSHLRQTVQKNSPSVETVNKFKSNSVWQMENEFYEFALDNFHFIKKQTLKNQQQHGREHPKMAHKDLPQALLLLSEMNVSAQHVASLVDNMIQKVRNGELSTDQGLSFLEVKYNMLLSYLINLTYVVLRKCSGEPIEGHPCIDRLIEIRTVMEKMRPIDHKLKYQIDKLVKNAVTGTSSDDPSTFKANPLNLATQEGYENSDSESSDESENGKTEKTKTGIYVPPKLSAVHYTETDSAQKKAKRLQEKNRKMMSSSIMHDIMDEYLDTPTEVSHEGSMNRAAISKEQKEREEYEEEYFTRLPLSKAEAKKSHSTIGTLGDELTNFSAGGSRKRKQKAYKSKGKNVKRKRFH
ncbi:hypothetical protein YQE_08248, partial [Dendroctonus ponderosae]